MNIKKKKLRSILILSFICCIVSASFVLDDQNSKLKRQLPQALGSSTGGGNGDLGKIIGSGDVLGGQPAQLESQRPKRTLNKRAGRPLSLGFLGGSTRGGEPEAAGQEAQTQQERSRKLGSNTKGDGSLLEGLLSDSPGFGAASGSASKKGSNAASGFSKGRMVPLSTAADRSNGNILGDSILDSLGIRAGSGSISKKGSNTPSVFSKGRTVPPSADDRLNSGLLGGAGPAK